MCKKYFISILILTVFFSANTAGIAFAALSCIVSTTCNSPDVVVLRMASVSNSHSELPSQNNYPEEVCCGGVTSLANTCTDTFGVVLRLSGNTNAHVEENTQTTTAYNGHNACLSVPAGGSVTIGYQNNNCNGFDTTVASMATATTNSHLGSAGDYTRKVCASATGVGGPPPPPPSCSNISCNAGTESGKPIQIPNQQEILRIADFNNDGRVDILDLSILLYWIDHPVGNISRYDLNQDSKLDFLDISILFYYWSVF